ncbi:hypothetical protein PMAYCL1PPCAC_24751, partial [Pristionchus mayeri]
LSSLRMTLLQVGLTNVSEKTMKEVENMLHEQFLRLEKKLSEEYRYSALLAEIIEGDFQYRKMGYKSLAEIEHQRATRLLLS